MESSVESRTQSSLGRCILLESRLGLRTNVTRALRATELFYDVVEAQSLSDGLTQLSAQEFDSCIIGSSVSKIRAAQFVRQAKEVSRNRELAVIALVSDGDEEILLAEAKPFPCPTIRWPGSVDELSQGILLAVRKTSPERTTTRFFAEGNAREDQKAPDESPISVLSALLSGELVNSADLLPRIRCGELGLDEKQRPTLSTRKTIAQVVDQVFPKEFHSRKILDFKKYFEGALILWVVEVITFSPASANDNFRRRLRLYASQLN